METKNVKKLKKELHERNFTRWGLDLNIPVSLMSALTLFAFALFAYLNIDSASESLSQFKGFIIERFDTVFIFAANFFIVALIILAFSKAGKIRIGGAEAKPQFSTFSWYAMLISAGMGIGLMYWSVGEPIYHVNSPIFSSSNPQLTALATTFFHWGIHPWAIYAIISLALAYFTFNKNLPLSPRSFFFPIFGDRIFGFLGDIIDTLSVLAALAGLATSLGLGVQQINSGLEHLFNVPYGVGIQILLITVITGIATLSVVSGIDKGVKFLSELNIKAAFVLMMILFITGPSLLIIKNLFLSTGLYIKAFIPASLFVNSVDSDWSHGWTVFYWAWWISWSPFVGMFIAKISKGRTVREFITAVLFVPTLLSIIWLTTFGTNALFVDGVTNGALTGIVSNEFSLSLFKMIEMMQNVLMVDWVKLLINGLGVFLIITFFVTSSDSGSLVVDSLASGGKIHSPVGQRVFWAVMEGFVAATLLAIGGKTALNVLQAAVITTGLPFAIIISIVTVVLLYEMLFKENIDKYKVKSKEKKAVKEVQK